MSENGFFFTPNEIPIGCRTPPARARIGPEQLQPWKSWKNAKNAFLKCPIFPCKQDIYWKLNGHLEIWNKHGLPACQCSVEIRMYRFELSTTCTGKTVSGHLYAGSSTPWAETRATWPKLEYSTLTQRAPKNGSKWGATCILGPSRSPCSSMLP